MAKSSVNKGYHESVLKLVIDGKQSITTVKDLQDSYYKLRAELNNMREVDNPELYRKKIADIQKVKQAWDSAREAINGAKEEVSSFKSQMQDLAKQAVAGLSVAGIAYGFVNGIKTMISKNAELSDSYGRVMKTTGLTEEAVDRLNDKFKKMDTRTANAELLGLAQVAGKLGISAEQDVEGFVRAADKIGVALGEDLGGVEESINSLGKLVDIFKVKDQFGLEEGLLKVGSAINELGASGTANEKNIVDFANRMAGIAPAANISLPAVLGLAAVQDELGQSMESSSTAIGQFIVGMGEDIPKYAKIAKLSVGEFAKLLKTDANEALLRVLEGSKSVGGGVQALAANMKAIDVNGARGIAALGAMADNIDLVRRRQQESSDAFDEGTSILNEFGVMNQTLGANLDKLGNRIDTIWQNTKLRDWLTQLTGVLVDQRSEFEKLIAEHHQAEISFNNLKESVDDNIDRYEELTSKTSLNSDEQSELQRIISKLSKEWPIAVSELDRYGNALSINTDIIRLNISEQERYLSTINRTAIEEGKAERERKLRRAEELKQELKNKVRTEWNGGGNQGVLSGGGQSSIRKLSNNELKEVSQELNKINDELFVIDINLKKLSGKTIDTKAMDAHSKSVLSDKNAVEERIKALKEEQSSGNVSAQRYKEIGDSITYLTAKLKDLNKVDGDTTTTTKSKEQEKAEEKARKKAEDERKRAQDEFDKLNALTAEFGADQLLLQVSQNKKEIAQENKKYEEKIRLWEVFKTQKGISDEQLLMADGRIALLEAEQEEAVNALRVRQEEATNKKIEDLRNAMAVRHATELEKERLRINKFYDDLERDNANNADVLAQLREDRARDLSDAVIREEERIKAETDRIQKQTIDADANRYTNRIAKIRSAYALELTELENKFALELQSTEAFEQAKAALKAKYGAQEKQVELQREEEIKELKLAVATTLSDALFSISKQNRDAELAQSLDRLEKQRSTELSNKNLTESQKKAINDRYDKLQRAEKLKAWKADQQASIKQGLINTALAVTKALPNVVAAAIAGATGLAQVAVIAAQKPPIFAKGGLIPRGPSHAQGGLNVVTPDNRVVANIEGGEPIISKATYANNRAVVDALIYSGQRLGGASINPMLMDSAVYAPRMADRVSNPLVQVSTPPVDNTELVRAIGALVDDRISKIQVELPYHILEERQKKVVEIRNSVNA